MGIGIKELLIILAIALVIFGTKKLASFGGDLGSAIKNFKKAMKDESGDKEGDAKKLGDTSGKVVDAEVTEHKRKV